MLNPIQIDNELANMGEAVMAEVFYDMRFEVNEYDFFSLKFQKEVQFEDFLKYFTQ